MQAERRLGSIEIFGTEYPLNYCIRNADEIGRLLSKNGKNESFGAFSPIANNIDILWLLMRDGADYATRFGGEDIHLTLKHEDLYTIFSPGDNERIVAAIREAIQLGGMRLVEVAEKKAKAAPAKERV